MTRTHIPDREEPVRAAAVIELEGEEARDSWDESCVESGFGELVGLIEHPAPDREKAAANG